MVPAEDLKKFPALYQFLVAYLSSWDDENKTPEEMATEFLKVTHPEKRMRVLSEGKEVLQLQPFPWESIAWAVNYDLTSEKEARDWFVHILKMLETKE